MTARLIDTDMAEVTFDNAECIRMYCAESLDTGDIHNPEKCAALYDAHPGFTSLLTEHPRGRMIIPGKLVESPAVGLFYQTIGNGFLLTETEAKQARTVYFGDSITYLLKECELVKTTSKGFRVYRALVEASREGALVGTYRMVAFRHVSFSPATNINTDAF